MSANSKIEWTDRTWNPATGCTKVSPGCDHCYAKTLHERFHGPEAFDTVTLHSERLDHPLRWRKPSRVFVNSMSDLFHADIPDEFIARVFAVMALSPHHTFQVLTKRHGRMRSLLSSTRFANLYDAAICDTADWDVRVAASAVDGALRLIGDTALLPLPNVWLGVSVETQHWADIRIPALLGTPAAVRFLSCEPLLGPLDLTWREDGDEGETSFPGGIGWVIVGGESGPGARPMHPDWARSIRNQCTAAGVPFFFKQWGEWSPAGYGARVGLQPYTSCTRHDVRPAEHWFPSPCPDDERLTHTVMHRIGKRRAGREVDGHAWDQYPQGHWGGVSDLDDEGSEL